MRCAYRTGVTVMIKKLTMMLLAAVIAAGTSSLLAQGVNSGLK